MVIVGTGMPQGMTVDSVEAQERLLSVLQVQSVQASPPHPTNIIKRMNK